MKIKVLSEEEVNKSKNIKLKSVKVERDYQLNRVLEVKFSDYIWRKWMRKNNHIAFNKCLFVAK